MKKLILTFAIVFGFVTVASAYLVPGNPAPRPVQPNPPRYNPPRNPPPHYPPRPVQPNPPNYGGYYQIELSFYGNYSFTSLNLLNEILRYSPRRSLEIVAVDVHFGNSWSSADILLKHNGYVVSTARANASYNTRLVPNTYVLLSPSTYQFDLDIRGQASIQSITVHYR